MTMPRNPFQWGTQAHRLYERLTYGPIYNIEIVKELAILGYQKKITQIRKALAGTGITIKTRSINHRGTLVEYRLAVENISYEGVISCPN